MKKVVLVTGGSSGIGKAISLFLQEKKYTVYGTSRNPSNYLDSTIPLLALDVQNQDSINLAVKELIQKEGQLDILINN
ncbi:MAG: NADP-dependent 3-hydroxy acid dehydrogenase YdfG, partial [Oleispira sp.]